MRIGFLTGSITKIGSGRTEAVPLARALSQLGCSVHGLETSRFRRGRATVESLEVHLEPLAAHLPPHSREIARALLRRLSPRARTAQPSGLGPVERAAGTALLGLADNLKLDVLYAFHNTNVARVLAGWPHPSRLLAINLIGFGIDPARGGSADTFPLQRRIFGHPHWDLHIAATRFELEQYRQVYEELGIDSGKLIHLPHSFDEGLFRPASEAPEAGQPAHPRRSRTLLYPVNVYPRKNIELAIDALSVLQRDIDVRLVVTGRIWDRDYHERMLRRAREQGVADRVEFLGGVPVDELIRLYRRADLTVFTSHQETFGHGIVESLGCGTPVVGPAWIIPCEEILSDSEGGWAAPKEPEGFAAAILAALEAGHEPIRLATSARVRYGNRAVAARFIERCREIRAEKDRYARTLVSINWKDLYRDAGNLL